MKIKLLISLTVMAVMLFTTACDDDNTVRESTDISVATPVYNSVSGFYVLNQGNWGANKASLDYFDYTTGVYTRNIYESANPGAVLALGDVGNDMALVDSLLYIVLNGSRKIEVLSAATAKRKGQIELPNGRYLCYDGKRYVYATSYAGPLVDGNPALQLGYVAKIDTHTMSVTDTCVVGYQPDGLTIMGNKLYVANSGGLLPEDVIESTLSIIDLSTFSKCGSVELAPNLGSVLADTNGHIWVESRGNYRDIAPALFCYDVQTETVAETFGRPASKLALYNGTLYVFGSQWDDATFAFSYQYYCIDTNTLLITNNSFLSQTEKDALVAPGGFAVNPVSGDILIGDACDYVSPGTVFSFSAKPEGNWHVKAGDIPCAFTFTGDVLK